MKKLLLGASVAMLCASSAVAVEPGVYPGLAFNAVSPDGSMAVSFSYEVITILDLVTGQEYAYEELYAPGNGNYISDNGIVVGSKLSFESACYFQGGEWYDLPGVNDHVWSYANGVTPDGSRIVGEVTPDGLVDIDVDATMLVPCYWDLQSDGTYSEPRPLPYPTLDLTDRAPQYITAVRISEDGKTIAGQIQDFSGFICQPILYTLGEDGEWTYTLLLDDMFHPEGFNLPEYPGDAPSTDPQDYMTEEEYAAYQLALQEWENTCLETGEWDYETYPNSLDYLSEEGREALAKAAEEYEIWDVKWTAFSMAFEELQDLVPIFEYNNLFLSSDGKMYATTDVREGMNWETWEFESTITPYVLDIADLENVTYKTYPNDALQVRISSLADDGTLLGQANNDDYITQAYILPAGSTAFEPLYSYVASKNATLGDWMKENMEHTYMAIDLETWDFVEKTDMFTGTPFTNPSMSLFAFAVENGWYDWDSVDMEDAEPYFATYGYLFDSTSLGVAPVRPAGTIGVKALPGAVLAFSGDVAYVKVYNISGACVLSVNAPDSTLSTGLPHGVYVVKAVAADGSASIAKVAF